MAALQNTVSDRGVVINGNALEREWQEMALQKIFYYMDKTNKDKKNELIEKNYIWASKLSWENQAQKLLNQYISKQTLEYKEMYNWTNNVPNIKEKEEFLNVLKYFNNNYVLKQHRTIQILEIGTYTGISLINIVKLIPNSKALGIDRWSNYKNPVNSEKSIMEFIEPLEVEKSFYKNIETEKLNDRISGIKGDSKEILLRMIKDNNHLFDFIYIDGSHKCLDCYLDIFLAWQLLSKNGILAIDDYMYFYYGDTLESPHEGVNKFLNENKEKYKILYSGYRIFLEKI